MFTGAFGSSEKLSLALVPWSNVLRMTLKLAYCFHECIYIARGERRMLFLVLQATGGQKSLWQALINRTERLHVSEGYRNSFYKPGDHKNERTSLARRKPDRGGMEATHLYVIGCHIKVISRH